jgi:hypothetical protein
MFHGGKKYSHNFWKKYPRQHWRIEEPDDYENLELQVQCWTTEEEYFVFFFV